MITNEVQRRSTEAHLRQFEEALVDLEAKHRDRKRSKLAQVEMGAVRAQADDLRAELEEYDRRRSGAVSTFEASSLEELAAPLIKGACSALTTNGVS